MREVVTLQIGSFANFTGAHFWNFQDERLGLEELEGRNSGEVNFDVLYRTGENRQGIQTYAPRMVLFDVKGSLGAVRASGSLDQSPPSSRICTWLGPHQVFESPQIPKNKFLESLDEEENMEVDPPEIVNNVTDSEKALALEETVSYWTDFLKVQLHPKSTVELKSSFFENDAPNYVGFRTYGDGIGLLEGGFAMEEAEERIRFFTEEADHLQGFNIIVDNAGGFSPLGSSVLQHLADEFSSVIRFVTAVTPPEPSQMTVPLKMSNVLSLTTVASLADFYVPLGRSSLSDVKFPFLSILDSKAYHTSGVYAAALDTYTLPCRLQAGSSNQVSETNIGGRSLQELIQNLSISRDSRVASCELSLPFPSISGEGEDSNGSISVLSSLQNLSFEEEVSTKLNFYSAESYVLRGALNKDVVASLSSAQSSLQKAIYKCNRGQCLRQICISNQQLAVPLPFPYIFSSKVGNCGQIDTLDVEQTELEERSKKGGCEVFSVPVLTRLTTGAPVVSFLENQGRILSSQIQRKGSLGSDMLKRWGFSVEEQEELLESIHSLVAGSKGTDEFDSD